MRHGIKTKKLNRTSSHRKALLKNLAIALIKSEQIKTTLPKAKVLRPFVEKLITIAKKPSLAATRSLVAVLGEDSIVKKLLSDVAVKSANRPGGYTRIYKMGFRYGDMAPMAMIELVDRTASDKSSDKLKDKPKVTKPKPTKTNEQTKTQPKASKAQSIKASGQTKVQPKAKKFIAAQ